MQVLTFNISIKDYNWRDGESKKMSGKSEYVFSMVYLICV